MGITVRPQLGLFIDEVLDLPAAPNQKITHKGFNLSSIELTANTAPPVANHLTAKVTLDGSGDATLDLTNFIGTDGSAQDATTLKVQAFLIKNPSGNATLVVSPGALNPFPLVGAGKDFDVVGGGYHLVYCPEGTPDVSGTVKTIDLAGGNDEIVYVTIVLG